MAPTSSYGDQLAAIRQRSITDAQVAAAVPNVNPQLAAGVTAQSQAYPYVSPQTNYALAANGNTPGDPVSQAVATSVVNKKGGGFWHDLGQVVTAPMRAAASLAGAAVSDIGAVAKPVARGLLTAAETPLQVGMGALRDVASATGDIGAGIVSGAATGAAVGAAGFNPFTVLGGAAVGAVAGGVLGGVAQARGVKVQGGFVDPLAQSTGGLALGALATGNNVDLGSGFLPGGAIHAAQVKNAEAAANINGHALTPGRMLASALARPGTTPYNVLSGLTDAVDTWELDPARQVGEAAGEERATSKLIPTSEATDQGAQGTNIVRNLARRAGILQTADPAIEPRPGHRFPHHRRRRPTVHRQGGRHRLGQRDPGGQQREDPVDDRQPARRRSRRAGRPRRPQERRAVRGPEGTGRGAVRPGHHQHPHSGAAGGPAGGDI